MHCELLLLATSVWTRKEVVVHDQHIFSLQYFRIVIESSYMSRAPAAINWETAGTWTKLPARASCPLLALFSHCCPTSLIAKAASCELVLYPLLCSISLH